MVRGRLLTVCAFVLIIVPGSAHAGLVPMNEPESVVRSGGDESGPVLVPEQGPDTPPVTQPVATVSAFEEELWRFTAGTRTSTVELEDVQWNRVFLRFHSWPNHPGGDPWDRLFRAAIDGVQVLHGTTTRGDFEITEDLTEYASLFDGTAVNVSVYLDSWVGAGIFVSADLLFYQEPTAAAGDARAEAVRSAFTFRGVSGTSTHTASLDFGDAPVERATIELFTSGHTQDGEFWYLSALGEPEPPRFKVYIDDEHVGTVHAMPYVYALLGFDGSPTAWLINQHLWWSGHQVLDQAGVYTGVAIIPPYRAELPDGLLPLLTGDRTVTLVKETHGGHWPTSVNFLIEHGESN